MSPECAKERYGMLKDVLMSSKELTKQIGGTVGEDLNSCIKSLDRLSEHLFIGWESVWHKGATEAAQKNRTKMVCNNMKDALHIVFELIDRQADGTLRRSGGPKVRNAPKPFVDEVTNPPSPPSLIIPRQSIIMKSAPTRLLPSPPPLPMSSPVADTLSSAPPPSPPVEHPHMQQKIVIPYQIHRLPVSASANERVENTPMIIMERAKYFTLRNMYNDACIKVRQLSDQLNICQTTTGAGNNAAWKLKVLKASCDRIYLEKMDMRLIAVEAIRLIGDISRHPCFDQFPEAIRVRIRAVIAQGLKPVRHETPILPKINGNARDVANQKIFRSPQWPTLQFSPSGIDHRRFICFVCGVIVTDPSTTVCDPAAMHSYFSRMNPSQMQQLRAAANLGSQGIAVVCKSHTLEEWIQRLHLKQQQSIIGRKRTHAEINRPEGDCEEDSAALFEETGEQIKEEIVEEKKVKIEEEEEGE